jgi:hypothetical protein
VCVCVCVRAPLLIKKQREKKKQELLLSLSSGFQFSKSTGKSCDILVADSGISLSHTHAFSYFNTVSYIF